MLVSVASVLLLLATLFQLCLACGAPWGSLTMGGRYPGTLPSGLRIAALFQLVLLALAGLIIFIRAGLLLPEYLDWSRMAIWAVVVFMAISSILNLITPSKWERRIWAPVVLLLLTCSVLIARSA
ncbi:hypothetical protein DFR42_106300 [Undibacterium pigrum]|uniref:Uncharacterized protein n=2 Tax=Undibacterium pigrum TaxID=401470 RepID=A0A318J318_9BURK|nr:hypothetical protein DFR42_106300 [Undibacterium pigrum]